MLLEDDHGGAVAAIHEALGFLTGADPLDADVARVGEVVDHQALAAAMRDRKLRVALDVYASEPPTATGEFTDAIAREPGLYGTRHIGASTDQAQEAIAAETVRIVKAFCETGAAPNAVN